MVLYVLWLVSLVCLSLAIYVLTPKLIDEIPRSAKHLVVIGTLVLAICWYVLWWFRGVGKASCSAPSQPQLWE